MKAVVLHELGQPPRVEDVPEPVPADGQELVRVTACPLTNFDRAHAAGTHYSKPAALPAVLGFIAAGRLGDGTRVLFGSPAGTMAEYAVTAREWCKEIPDGLDDETAAAAQNPALSAWMGLDWRGKLEPGQHVLILGATGVTGKLAVQLARRMGAGRIVAAGRNEEVLAELSRLGADATIQLSQPDDALRAAFAAHEYHVVLDYLWGHPTEVLLSSLGATGMELRHAPIRLVQAGVMAGSHISLHAEVLRSSGLEILGSGSGNAAPTDLITAKLHELMVLLAKGELRIDVNRVPLAEAQTVWDLDQRGRRTVLIP